jgi:hypothetical protein
MSGVGFKPKKFKNYFTVAELAAYVGRERTRIIKLEAEGKIPKAQRLQLGQISIRLWSPEQAKEIRRLFKTTIKPGRPRNDE